MTRGDDASAAPEPGKPEAAAQENAAPDTDTPDTDVTDTDVTDTDARETGAPGSAESEDGAPARGRRRVMARGATLIVIVALAGVVGWLAWGYFSTDPAHDDAAAAVGQTLQEEGEPQSNGAGAPVVWGRGTGPATAAVRAASSGTEALFGYTYDKVQQQLDDAAGLLTGDFRSEFRDYAEQQVIPTAQDQKASVAATVVGAAPVRFSGDSAQVLVYLDQVAKTEGAEQSAFTPSQVMVSLEKPDDEWLISDVQRITY